MFGLGKSSTSAHPSYFDIRINSNYKNLIIVRGSHYESPSVMLTGHLVIALPDPLNIKKISLKLVGRYKLDFLEVLEQSNTTIANPVKEETVVFEVVWDNLLLSSEGVITIGDASYNNERPSLLASSNNSTSSLTSRRLIRTQSPTQLQFQENGISGTPFESSSTPNSRTNYILPNGNYELPFKCILPGDIPETVEGLQAGSILYKFEANIERAGFNKSPISKQKYFRILRTLSSDNLSLNETISIGKSWPDKIQYEVSIPSRAVPIGGKSPISILLIPLCKGMKLGLIKAQIIQYYAFKGLNGDIYDDELCCLDVTMAEMEEKELSDKLSIDSFITIPLNLKKVTQDCDFKQDFIKVRHKLKLQINLIMPSGNISELRANLPINLFISPNVEMTGRMIVLDKHGKIHFRKEEEKLFERNKILGSNELNESNNFGIIDTTIAPPNYDEHIFDRILFGENNSNSHNNSSILPSQQFQVIDTSGDYSFNNGQTFESNVEYDNNSSSPTTPTETIPPDSTNLQRRVDGLKFDKISEIPSYQDAMNNDDPNPIEEFAPGYHIDRVQSSLNLRESVLRPSPLRSSSSGDLVSRPRKASSNDLRKIANLSKFKR